MNKQASFDINGRTTLTTLIFIGSILLTVLLIAPGIVGALINELGLSPSQAGYVISADLAGLAFATLPALWWLNRLNWQLVVTIGLTFTVVLNLISAWTVDYQQFLIVRFLCGLSGGTVVAVCLASFGLTRRPDRTYAMWVALQLIIGAVGLAILPHVLPLYGIKIIFIPLAIFVATGIPFLRHFPVGANIHMEAANQGSSKGKPPLPVLKIGLGILGVYVFYVSLTGVWTYIERMGLTASLTEKNIGYVLAVSSIMGIAGAVTASILDTRFGRFLPTAIGMFLILAGLFLLYASNTLTFRNVILYSAGAFLFKYTWTFILPYFLAAIASQDPSGRAIVINNFFAGAGMASGPLVAAQFINNGDYVPVVVLGIVCMILCFVFLLPLILVGQSSKKLVRNLVPSSADAD